MIKVIVNAVLFLLFSATVSWSLTVEALGEAEIVGDDVASARTMAISRAKWSALESSAGVKIKIDTIMNNAVLADEAIKTTVSATVKSFLITDEGKDGNLYWVAVKCEIEPDEAKKTFENMAKNTSIIVFLRIEGENGKISYGGALSKAIENELIDGGFDVVNHAFLSSDDIALMEKSLTLGEYELMKEISSKTMSGSILVCRLYYSSLGKDVGYGKVDFSIISGVLEWGLVGDIDGKKSLLGAGSFNGRGQGATIPQAVNNLTSNMAKSGSVKVVSAVSQKLLGENGKTVLVSINGSSNPRLLKEVKEDLKNIPFVLDVKERNLKDLVVNYPEKTYYLASFLQKNNKYKIIKMDDVQIVIERR